MSGSNQEKKESEKKGQEKRSSKGQSTFGGKERRSISDNNIGASRYFGSLSSISPAPLNSNESIISVTTPSNSSLLPSKEDNLVRLNVYGLTAVNQILNYTGLGIYHSGVEIYGMEFAYGGYNKPVPSIYRMKKPRDLASLSDIVDRFHFKETIELKPTKYSYEDVRGILLDLGKKGWIGTNYHLLYRNCNSFSNELCKLLCGMTIPPWVNRVASIFSKFPYLIRLLPEEYFTPAALREELKTNTASTAGKETQQVSRIPSPQKQVNGEKQPQMKPIKVVLTNGAEETKSKELSKTCCKSTLSNFSEAGKEARLPGPSEESSVLDKSSLDSDVSVMSVENSFADETQPNGTETNEEPTMELTEKQVDKANVEERDEQEKEKEKEDTEKEE